MGAQLMVTVERVETFRRNGLEAWIDRIPPFDCLLGMCQVDGCPGGPDLGGRGHGWGTARYWWVMRGEGLAVVWWWFADEHLPETVTHMNETRGPGWRQNHWPMGGGLTHHSTVPTSVDPESHDDCDLVDGVCYFDGSFAAADVGMERYKQDGPEAAWEWLEGYWHRQMAAITGSRVA